MDIRTVFWARHHNYFMCTYVWIFFVSQSNSYQAVLITDGASSYSIFIYQCGLLDSASIAGIGFFINSTHFEEHTLSNSRTSSNISCMSYPHSPWSSVLYPLRGEMFCIMQAYDLCAITSDDYGLECPHIEKCLPISDVLTMSIDSLYLHTQV